MTMIYPAKGINPQDGKAVGLEIGWDHETGYFYGVDRQVKNEFAVELRELVSGTGVWAYDVLIERTSPFMHWTTQLYQALRDAPAADRAKRLGANDRVVKLLISFDDRFRKLTRT